MCCQTFNKTSQKKMRVSNPTPFSLTVGAALGEGFAHATVGWVPARPSQIPQPGGRWGAGCLPKPVDTAPAARVEGQDIEVGTDAEIKALCRPQLIDVWRQGGDTLVLEQLRRKLEELEERRGSSLFNRRSTGQRELPAPPHVAPLSLVEFIQKSEYQHCTQLPPGGGGGGGEEEEELFAIRSTRACAN